MTTKLVILDLDGVIFDSRMHHYSALNKALSEVNSDYEITMREHLTVYDGLNTNKKLEMLTQNKGLPTSYYSQIWKRKQELTFEIIKDNVDTDYKLIEIFKQLKMDGIKIWVCSNSIRDTLKTCLYKSL